MCGIIAEFNKSPKQKKGKPQIINKANTFIQNQYQDQHSRGQKGFGIIRIKENGNIEIDRATEEIKFLLDLYLKPSEMIIAHHRAPTSTDNKIKQTHPIYVSNPLLKADYYVIHNGIISKSEKLKEKHEKLGFIYTTEQKSGPYYSGGVERIAFNDTESLAIELALVIEEKQNEVETENYAAYIVLQINKKTQKAEKVYFGRNKSAALNLSITKNSIKISSEGEGEKVLEDTLWSFNPMAKKFKLESKEIIFKEKEEIKTQTTIPFGYKKEENTENKDNIKQIEASKEATMVSLETRPWSSKTNPEDDNYDQVFIDKKCYTEEILKDYKDWIKTDDTDMLETSIDTTLEDQIERIGKIVSYFKETLLCRQVDIRERGFYLSQISAVMKTMETLTDVTSEEYDLKAIKESYKKEEGYNMSEIEKETMGYKMEKNGSHVHKEREPGELEWQRFG